MAGPLFPGPRARRRAATGLLLSLGSILLTVIVILGLAGLPLLISERTGRLELSIGKPLEAARDFVSSVLDGSVLEYRIGRTVWDFRVMGPKFLRVSFQYTALPGALGLALGTIAGIARRGRRGGPGPARPDLLPDLVLATPDFLLILLAQFLFSALFEALGTALPYGGTDGRLALLPLLVMTVFPFFLARRAAGEEAARAEAEDYVRFARAKGLPEGPLVRRHVGAAVIPRLEADLPLLIAFMQGSLFMTELAFSLPGMARLLFNSAFAGGRGFVLRRIYQYDFVVIALLGLAISCVATWLLLRLALGLARKALTGE